MISSLSCLIAFLNCGLWFLSLKNLSSIIFSSAAAAANFKPLFVCGAVGISIVFSIEPLPESIVVIPQPPCSLISFCLSFFSASVSKG